MLCKNTTQQHFHDFVKVTNKDDACTVVLKSDSEDVTVITKQARANEITEVKPSIIKSTCADPERQNLIIAPSNATTTILDADEISEDDTITILDADEINVSVLVDQPSIVINNFNIDLEYDQPEIEEKILMLIIFSELQNELVNIDDQEYADYESSEATALTDPVVELQPDEVAEIEKSQTLENEKDKGQDPVFPGSSRKLGFMILFICCLSIRFKLPDEALNYIMMLAGMVLPSGHNMIQSIYTLKEYLRKFVSCSKVHYLCSTCGTHVSKNDKTCKNKTCNQNLSTQGAIGYFIQHSVIDQLKIMCQRSSFLKKIRTHRFEHYKANTDGHLTDVYDGYMYKKIV
ncbi:unnamed protein product [Mytilus coruscus]|uniref:Uncharacterized protein n=1 Tax=Mytilus coruscus TaxID=42192 RepID=A0A6J8B9R3_MYTCO|nr:unnamed protein product [Mytilus coruscus]